MSPLSTFVNGLLPEVSTSKIREDLCSAVATEKNEGATGRSFYAVISAHNCRHISAGIYLWQGTLT